MTRPGKALRKRMYDGRVHGRWGSAGVPYSGPTPSSSKIPCKPSSAAWETVYAFRATVDMGDLSQRKGSPASKVRGHRRQEDDIMHISAFLSNESVETHVLRLLLLLHRLHSTKKTENKNSCSGLQIGLFYEENQGVERWRNKSIWRKDRRGPSLVCDCCLCSPAMVQQAEVRVRPLSSPALLLSVL